MKQFTSLLFISLLTSPLFSQVTEDWSSQDDYYGKDGIMVAVDAADNAFTVSDIFNGDIYLTKRSIDGTILWQTGYDNTTPSQWEQAGWVTIDINGDAIVTGFTNTGFGTDWYPVQMVTMKFNGEDGTLLWRVTYNTGSAYRGRIVLTDSEGNIYVGGELMAFMVAHSEVGNMMVKKYDTNGNEIWSVTENEFGDAMPGPLKTMKFDNEGNIIISGYHSSMAKINPAGSVEWSTIAVGGGVTDFSIDPSNNIFTLYQAPFGTPFSTYDFVAKVFSPDGIVLWTQHYDFGGEEFATQIECDNSGGAFITGYSGNGGYFDWVTFKIGITGSIQWSQFYDAHTGNDEFPKMMVKDNDDNIYITGQGGPWPGYFWTSLTQMVTIKYSTDGVEEWVALHDLYTNVGTAICLASDNSIYAIAQMYATTIHYTQAEPIICVVPTGLFTNNITTIKARFNWTVVPGAFQYEVWYKKASGGGWKKKFVPGIMNKLNAKNLTCNTSYIWKMRTVCDTVGIDAKSDFSADQMFTTLACREESVMEANISIYPNPASNMITVSTGDQLITQIEIFDLSGKLVMKIDGIQNTEFSIDLTNLPTGQFILRLRTEEQSINRQIIISR